MACGSGVAPGNTGSFVVHLYHPGLLGRNRIVNVNDLEVSLLYSLY